MNRSNEERIEQFKKLKKDIIKENLHLLDVKARLAQFIILEDVLTESIKELEERFKLWEH